MHASYGSLLSEYINLSDSSANYDESDIELLELGLSSSEILDSDFTSSKNTSGNCEPDIELLELGLRSPEVLDSDFASSKNIGSNYEADIELLELGSSFSGSLSDDFTSDKISNCSSNSSHIKYDKYSIASAIIGEIVMCIAIIFMIILILARYF